MKDKFWFIALCGVVNGAFVALLTCECLASCLTSIVMPQSRRKEALGADRSRARSDEEYLGGKHDKIFIAVGLGLVVLAALLLT